MSQSSGLRSPLSVSEVVPDAPTLEGAVVRQTVCDRIGRVAECFQSGSGVYDLYPQRVAVQPSVVLRIPALPRWAAGRPFGPCFPCACASAQCLSTGARLLDVGVVLTCTGFRLGGRARHRRACLPVRHRRPVRALHHRARLPVRGTVVPSGHCTTGHVCPFGTVVPSGHCTTGHVCPFGTVVPSGHCTTGHVCPLGTVVPSGHDTTGHVCPLGTVVPSGQVMSGHWVLVLGVHAPHEARSSTHGVTNVRERCRTVRDIALLATTPRLAPAPHQPVLVQWPCLRDCRHPGARWWGVFRTAFLEPRCCHRGSIRRRCAWFRPRRAGMHRPVSLSRAGRARWQDAGSSFGWALPSAAAARGVAVVSAVAGVQGGPSDSAGARRSTPRIGRTEHTTRTSTYGSGGPAKRAPGPVASNRHGCPSW